MRVGQFRNAMAAGIAFAALFLAGFALFVSASPNIKKHDSSSTVAAKWLDSFHASGNRVAYVLGALLLMLSALALVWFAAGLSERLLPFGLLESRLVLSFGILAAAGLGLSVLGAGTVAGSSIFGNENLPTSGEAVRLISETFFPAIVVVFGFGAAGLIAAATTATARTAILPRWLVWFGWIAAAGSLLATVLFFTLLLPLLWAMIVGAIGIARAPDADDALLTPAPPAAPAV